MSDACVHDAGFFPDERTNEQADSRSWISEKSKFFKEYDGMKPGAIVLV